MNPTAAADLQPGPHVFRGEAEEQPALVAEAPDEQAQDNLESQVEQAFGGRTAGQGN